MRRLAALGVLVNISEMDVRIRDRGRRPRRRASRSSAASTASSSRLCVAEPACHAVTFWGFTDRYSWIDSFFGPDDPLPFDESYAPKPAFFGVQDALRRR